MGKAIQFIRKNPSCTLGLVILLLTVFITLLAPLIVPYDPLVNLPSDKLAAPLGFDGYVEGHLLGTDFIGRDLLSRILVGIQTSMIISILAVGSAVILGSVIGLISGLAHPGPLDSILMRVTDIQMGFPFVVLAIIILTMVAPTRISCIAVLILASWPAYARVVRSNVMLEKEMDYIAAAKIMGAGRFRIAGKYLSRNLLPSIIPVVPMDIAAAVITESLLSFMQIGIQSPDISLGNIMADGRNYIATSWWITALPGIAILIIVIGLNLVGDTLQMRLDPKLRK